MSRMEKSSDVQISTLPPVIASVREGQGTSLHRIKTDGVEEYRLTGLGKTLYVFNSWQYHVLSALFSHGGDSYPTLLVNVNDRFGTKLTQADIEAFFSDLAQKKLFDDVNAPRHPLTGPFCNGQNRGAAVNVKTGETNLNTRKPKDMWYTVHLFNPTQFVKAISPILPIGRYLVYALPVLIFVALVIVWDHPPAISQELSSLFGIGLYARIVFSLLTISVLSVMATACVAQAYGATVNSIDFVLIFSFLPRLLAEPEDTDKLSRRQKLWLHATPLLMRLGTCSTSIILWYYGRSLQGPVTDFFGTLAFVSFIYSLEHICPFYKASGYNTLAEFLGDPNFRDKAFLAVMNKWKGNSYAKIDGNLFIAYALACTLFISTVCAIMLMALHNYLYMYGGLGAESLMVVSVVIALICHRFWMKLKEVNEAYEERQKFERWRSHVINVDAKAEEQKEKEKKNEKPGTAVYYLKRAGLAALAIGLLLPYPYHATGEVFLSPAQQQQISTDLAGTIGEVYYDGGEMLDKGTVVARLTSNDQKNQLEFYKANLEEQKVVVEQLEAKLNVVTTQSKYSDEKYKRQKELYDGHAISFDALETFESAAEVDKQQVLQTQSEIFTARAAIQPIEAQIKMYQDQIDRSDLKMPFKGKLASLHLMERQGHFLDRGSSFAMSEDDESFDVTLNIPETDSPYVMPGAYVEVHLAAFPGRTFAGKVKEIDPSVQDQKSVGNMMKIIGTFKADDNLLKSGMTGYAKVTGKRMMMWQILVQPVYRFLTVEMWAWIP